MRYIFSGGELKAADIAEYIEMHLRHRERLQRKYDYYDGKIRIEKGVKRELAANNRLNTNLAGYITDTATAYFVGIPPMYSYEDERLAEILGDIYDANDESTVDYEIAENMSIAGEGYDLVYISDDKEVRFRSVDPRDAFLIIDDTIECRVLAGVRMWRKKQNGQKVLHGELYLPALTRQFRYEGGAVIFYAEAATPFSRVNLTEYPNNRHRTGDFEKVTANIDGYNLAISDVADDLQDTANAYLVLRGFERPDEETLDTLKHERVLGLPNDSDAGFITKQLSDSMTKNHIKTLRQDIMQVAKVPDLLDESFSGNSSGVALQYKMWGISQLFRTKSKYMDRGLFARARLVTEGLRVTHGLNLEEDVSKIMSIKFTQNMPQDVATILDNAIKAGSVVSGETAREMAAPATGVSPEDEKKRMEDEAAGGDYAMDNGPLKMDGGQSSAANTRKSAKKQAEK